jgi:hypothetical protein
LSVVAADPSDKSLGYFRSPLPGLEPGSPLPRADTNSLPLRFSQLARPAERVVRFRLFLLAREGRAEHLVRLGAVVVDLDGLAARLLGAGPLFLLVEDFAQGDGI